MKSMIGVWEGGACPIYRFLLNSDNLHADWLANKFFLKRPLQLDSR